MSAGKVRLPVRFPIMPLKTFILVAVLALFGAPQPVLAEEPQALSVSPLVIETAKGSFDFEVEVALSPDEKRTGLMFRKHMAADHGMLFYYPFPQRIGMWMKDTEIPLDMVFLYKDGTVASIFEGAVPQSLDTIESGDYVNGVLELNAGVVEKLGIHEGDKVRHEIFGNLKGGKHD